MINPNELRKGNLLHFLIKNEHGGTVRARIETVLTTWQINKIDEMEDVDDFWAPIPLTPEWLEKYGFVNGGPHDGGNSSWRCKGFPFSLSVCDGGTGVDVYYYDDNDCIYVSGHDYVHQLQNLYFCLTGDELQINHSTSASGTQ